MNQNILLGQWASWMNNKLDGNEPNDPMSTHYELANDSVEKLETVLKEMNIDVQFLLPEIKRAIENCQYASFSEPNGLLDYTINYMFLTDQLSNIERVLAEEQPEVVAELRSRST